MRVRRQTVTYISGLTLFMFFSFNVTACAQNVHSDSYSPQVIRKVPLGQKVVALTFDDGPSAEFTPKILHILNQYHAKATFFVIGSRVERYPSLVRQLFYNDDEVANHSYSHTIMTRKRETTTETELDSTQNAVETVLGYRQPRVFRPPFGRVDRTLLRTARKKDYAVVLWSIDSHDWADPGVERIVNQVTSRVHNGDIILFHDQGGNRKQTVESVKRIIPILQERGYEFVTVSELLNYSNLKRD
ncbi:polysaccharide deacetylase family protein [Alicyclobacillus pomorum]|uniref:polysaccharide deacetylase family protein n=2 Tax=Alicyclobacillus pomorum TaxID=204470 RepID=UPI00041D6D55